MKMNVKNFLNVSLTSETCQGNRLKSGIYNMLLVTTSLLLPLMATGNELSKAINKDYESYLKPLFKHFHRNPELSLLEFKTAKRIVGELRQLGFEVTEQVGGTGVVAMYKNGEGPLVMMRADMDGLPVEENSGLDYASTAIHVDPVTKHTVKVMHACGHDVHITSLVGTARQMIERKDNWSGTLMLIAQPAEEIGTGARQMMQDNLYKRFGKPDYALAFHVAAGLESGIINVVDGSPFAGVDSVDIIVHGVGAHGASPHSGKDPIVLASQIVLALQTIVSRELGPREPAVITVGSFHSGTKHNIISDKAVLQLTVRNTNVATRKKLLDAIERTAVNMGRVAGLPEDKLPEVKILDENVPPTVNTVELAMRLRKLWRQNMGEEQVVSIYPEGMGGEDFPYFTIDDRIPSVYFSVGGTKKADIEAARNGGPAIPSHHSPLFKVDPDLSVTKGVEATVLALLDLMPVQ